MQARHKFDSHPHETATYEGETVADELGVEEVDVEVGVEDNEDKKSKMIFIFLYVFRESSKRVSIFDRETEAKASRLGKACSDPVACSLI